jgi:uncharacterized protein (TIGR02117 family)
MHNRIIAIKLIIVLSLLLKIQVVSKDINEKTQIYLINQAWHVGFLIKVDSTSKKVIPLLNEFENYEYVDIGWGDEDFYQNDGINYYYAAKAMLISTSSVIKITGHKASRNSILKWVNDYRSVSLDTEQYQRLLNYIETSLLRIKHGYVKTSSFADGAIGFYKSPLKYHLFMTCNTWIAEGLNESGVSIDTDWIIRTEDLFAAIDELVEK